MFNVPPSMRVLLLSIVGMFVSFSACNEGVAVPDDPSRYCEESPCEAGCFDPADPPPECMDPECDAFCDPCADDCNACKANCAERLVGPELAEAVCNGTLVESRPDGTTRWEVVFHPASDAPSWLFSLWGETQKQLVGVQWRLPDSSVIDLDTWLLFNDHQQNIQPSVLTLLNPIAPAYQDLLQTGEHTVVVDLESTEPPCWRVTSQLPLQEGLPFRLRLRLVAVGTEFTDVAQMQSDPLFLDALTYAQAQFAEAGIELYVHEWVVADQPTRDAFAVVSDGVRARELLMELPASERADAITELSVNVALIDRFGDGSDLAGITGGLPGPVALHANEASGVVLSMELLPFYRGPEQVAKILVHELGHYLGLRHTSSWPSLGFDPLDDTPECSQSVFTSNSNDCPDAYNMMFPSLSMREPHWWSDEQVQVMRWHPAVTQRTE